MKEDTIIGFIGFGLIGGSIARAIKAEIKGYQLIAFDYYINKPNHSLQEALADGTLDKVTKDLEQDFRLCNIIFLCAPVLTNINYLQRLKTCISKDCIITDVGSVKGNIHKAVQEAGLSRHFIGGHPMAGSEMTGYSNSHPLLLENAYYILTPSEDVSAEAVSIMTEIVRLVHAIPLLLDPLEHDKITAAISHVPHIIAAGLVNLIRTSDGEEEKMKMLAAGGFKDITRIASSSPEMWQNICLTNTNSIIAILRTYIDLLKKAEAALSDQDETYLYQLFDAAAIYRNSIPNAKGLMNRFYEAYLDISDEPGAIAIIATLLGSNGISIKNIGIVHNREFEQGVLRIEFYKEEALSQALKILTSRNYTIYERG